MTNDELLHKWVNQTIAPEELLIFQQRPEYGELVELYRQTEYLTAPAFDESGMLQNILKQQKSPLKVVRTAKRVSMGNYIKYGLAASLLLIAGWFFFTQLDASTTILAATGEQKEGMLPDESSYILNAESTLTFNAKNWSDHRVLDLFGEAFFNVKKGAQFLVKTTNGSVQVLGTQFNVWSREGVLEVKCKTGKVAILSNKGNTLQELLPNEVVRIKAGEIVETWTEDLAEIDSWVQGISKLRKVTVSTVLAELKRQFDIEIDNGNINTSTVISCNFQHNNLELALKTALSAAGIQYQIAGKRVFLSEE